MRFLYIDENGELFLSKYFTEHIPPYAILSHIWGADEDEITYQDFEMPTPPQKSGLAKLKFCVEQAKRDGLQYSWVDTCCINRFNHAELSEAITSMFRWYKNSTKCYVYMNDVSVPEDASIGQSDNWDTVFQGSRYWTRGWTLQELLAPRQVEFFSEEWHFIGAKDALEQQIQTATGIPAPALRGAALSGFTIDERLQWASNRMTKRPEDKAYCLIGIFDISMSMRYGEGSHAFERLLKKIKKLPEAKHEPLDGDDRKVRDQILSSLLFPEIDSRRQQIQMPRVGTYEWVLEENLPQEKAYSNFVSWLRDPSPPSQIYSISGKPGAGKSSLMAFLAAKLDSGPDSISSRRLFSGQLSSYFFWDPGHSDLQRSLSGMLRTLLYDLFEQNPEYILKAVTFRRWRSTSASSTSTLEWTVVELQGTLERCLKLLGKYETVMLLIDGLDECVDDKGDYSRLLTVVKDLSALPNVKLCVSCRPMPVFNQLLECGPVLPLHELNYDDIATYVQKTLREDELFRTLGSSNPLKAIEIERRVIERAEGVFLWAVLVVRDLCRSARNGAGLSDLEALLYSIPDDLAEYFEKMLSSIEPEHTYEASTFLQLAFWQETSFVTLQHLTLLDLFYTIDFMNSARGPITQSDLLDLSSPQNVYTRLESTSRRLQSRCKGILKCYHDPALPWLDGEEFTPVLSISGVDYTKRQQNLVRKCEINSPKIRLSSEDDSLSAFGYRVEYLHRSLRDYLLNPGTFRWLVSHTDGPINARRSLCAARLAEAEAVVKAQCDPRIAIFQTGHVVAVLATPEMRQHPDTLPMFSRLLSVIQYALSRPGSLTNVRFLYIVAPLEEWQNEGSTALSLAIDFGIDIVVRQRLSTAQIKEKAGRPLLDYALRPRFVDCQSLEIGLQTPNVSYVSQMIHLGADPNEMYEGTSIFSAYLCFMNDCFHEFTLAPETLDHYFSVTEALIRQGAASHLRLSWLCHPGNFQTYVGSWAYDLQSLDQEEIFDRRWLGLKPSKTSWSVENQDMCELSGLLECFRPWFGNGVDHLQSLIMPQPYEHPTSPTRTISFS